MVMVVIVLGVGSGDTGADGVEVVVMMVEVIMVEKMVDLVVSMVGV